MRTDGIASELRSVVLCADDFGMTEGVSRGILDLIHMGRLSATSVMANCRWWERLGPELCAAARGGGIGIGLHLNLTLGRAFGELPGLTHERALPRLGPLLQRAFQGGLPCLEIRAEIEAQLAAFERVFGRAPDFVDGHQHVHVLPGIRGELLAVLTHNGLAGQVWVRDPSDSIGAIVRRGAVPAKALFVTALASGFRRAARGAGFITNAGFSGFSAFDPTADAALLFNRAFRALGADPLVMCHPGRIDDELREIDPVIGSRDRELAYLGSDRFEALLSGRRIELAPAPRRARA